MPAKGDEEPDSQEAVEAAPHKAAPHVILAHLVVKLMRGMKIRVMEPLAERIAPGVMAVIMDPFIFISYLLRAMV